MPLASVPTIKTPLQGCLSLLRARLTTAACSARECMIRWVSQSCDIPSDGGGEQCNGVASTARRGRARLEARQPSASAGRRRTPTARAPPRWQEESASSTLVSAPSAQGLTLAASARRTLPPTTVNRSTAIVWCAAARPTTLDSPCPDDLRGDRPGGAREAGITGTPAADPAKPSGTQESRGTQSPRAQAPGSARARSVSRWPTAR
jgi:hypothetical protein